MVIDGVSHFETDPDVVTSQAIRPYFGGAIWVMSLGSPMVPLTDEIGPQKVMHTIILYGQAFIYLWQGPALTRI